MLEIEPSKTAFLVFIKVNMISRALAALILPLTAMDLALAMELPNKEEMICFKKTDALFFILNWFGKLIYMHKRARKKSKLSTDDHKPNCNAELSIKI